MFRLIIAVIVLGMIFTFGLDFAADKFGMNKKDAMESLQMYIKDNGLADSIESAKCTDADHDGDSLIPCEYLTTSGKTIKKECGGWLLFGRKDSSPTCEDMDEVKVLD